MIPLQQKTCLELGLTGTKSGMKEAKVLVIGYTPAKIPPVISFSFRTFTISYVRKGDGRVKWRDSVNISSHKTKNWNNFGTFSVGMDRARALVGSGCSELSSII